MCMRLKTHYVVVRCCSASRLKITGDGYVYVSLTYVCMSTTWCVRVCVRLLSVCVVRERDWPLAMISPSAAKMLNCIVCIGLRTYFLSIIFFSEGLMKDD